MGVFERVFHSVLFEVLAVSFSILGLSVFTDHDLNKLSGTMIVIATMAMCWNYLFNLVFDHFVKGEKINRTIGTRVVHVVLFEAGLLVLTVPVMAYMLHVTLWDALVMDVGVTVFVTIYAFIFNLSYDHVRAWIVKTRSQSAVTAGY